MMERLPKIISVQSGRRGGVFTARVVWELVVAISANRVEMLPDRVAWVFRDHLPLEGTAYPGVPFATCRGVSCKRVDGGIYHFEAEYSDENSRDQPATSENPLEDLPVVRPVAGTREIAITRDRDNAGILNTAGDPILQTRDQQFVGLSISVKVADVPSYVLDLVDTQNATPIRIRDWYINRNVGRFVLPSDFLSEPKSRNEITYYDFRYEIAIDARDKHYGRPLNAGFRQRVPVDPEADPVEYQLEAILADDGSQPSEPVPLDATGAAIINPDPEDVLFLKIKKYPEADYTVIPGVLPWTDAPEDDP